MCSHSCQLSSAHCRADQSCLTPSELKREIGPGPTHGRRSSAIVGLEEAHQKINNLTAPPALCIRVLAESQRVQLLG